MKDSKRQQLSEAIKELRDKEKGGPSRGISGRTVRAERQQRRRRRGGRKGRTP